MTEPKITVGLDGRVVVTLVVGQVYESKAPTGHKLRWFIEGTPEEDQQRGMGYRNRAEAGRALADRVIEASRA